MPPATGWRARPQGSEELLQGGAGLAFADPDDRTVAVVVGDHRQVAVALAVGDLIDPDPVQPVQAVIVDVRGNDPDHDRGHGLPGAAQQPGDGGLVGALGQPGDDVFEVAGEPGGWARPGHRLGPHPLTAPAGQPADLGLQEQPRGAQVQVPPAAGGPVIDRSGRPAARAVQAATSAAQADDDPAWGELHLGHVSTGDGEHLVECGRGAHASLRRGSVGLAAPNLRRTARARPP
jgi:hypothetical protein